jgi:nucleoside-diphosphate-sugar epimerase
MILVTGGTGLVGAHLLLHLIESRSIGRKECAIYRNLESIEKQSRYLVFTKELFDYRMDRGRYRKYSITRTAFQGIEYVYHCAAMISFDLKMKLYCVKQTLKELQILLILSDRRGKNYATLARQLHLAT